MFRGVILICDACVQFTQGNEPASKLVDSIEANARRYVNLFCEAVDEIMPPATVPPSDQDDVIDVILQQRALLMEQNQGENVPTFPPQLMRR